ncbi:MAG TPA: cyclic nucleotide-binding domain-containing protein [bacterium]|nr:cyclic nucleotide-binding domain-containing protein [bacterium]
MATVSDAPVRLSESKGILKILVVDPQPGTRSILKGSLRTLEMVQSVMDRGSTAGLEDVLAQNPVHLVILATELAENENPLDVIRHLKARHVAERTRFILVAPTVDEALRREGAKLGVTGYLSKPYDLQRLEQALWDGLGMKPPPPAAPKAAAPAREAATGGAARDILERLRQIQIFSSFTDQELVALLKICQSRRIPAKEYVFREGDPGDHLYVLVSGQVEIQQQRDGETRRLVTMQPGDCFGEMAIIDSGARSADAQAVADAYVIEVKAETVNRDDDLIALKLVRQLAILLVHKLRKQSR